MAAPILDGSGHVTSGGASSITVTVSTTGAGYVLVFPGGNGGPVTSVSGSTLGAFTKKVSGGNTGFYVDCWYKASTGALTSEVITVTQTTNAFITVDALGVKGATGFDANAGAVVLTTNSSDLLVSTTTAETFVAAAYRMGSQPTPTAGTGMTQVSGANFQLTEYKRVTTAQTNLDMAIGTGAGDPNGGVAVALVGAASTTAVGTAAGTSTAAAFTPRAIGTASGTSTATATMVPRHLMGVNVSALEFGPAALPGMAGVDYLIPRISDLDYYKGKGLTLIRLPFLWERVQPTLNAALDTTYLGYIKAYVAAAYSRGMRVILDVHNYGRYSVSGTPTIIGTSPVTNSAFADLWTRLATAFVGNPGIWAYGLMNEPHDMGGSTVWPAAAQAAASAIAAVDSATTILVPGDAYSGAWSWTTNNNTLNVTAANPIVYEAHLYFDTDHSGTYAAGTYAGEGVTATSGATQVSNFTNWLAANNYKGFIGEWAFPSDEPSLWGPLALNFLDAIERAGCSATYFAGGDWGPQGRSIIIDPNGGVDRPQMTAVAAHPSTVQYSPTWAGSAAGAGTANATGARVTANVGSAAGTSTASGVGKKQARAVGSGAGTSAATSSGKTQARTGGATTGTSSASAVGESSSQSIGAAAGFSTAAASIVTLCVASGTADGSASVAAVGTGPAQATGFATGTGLASGFAGSIAMASASVVVVGVGASLATASANASGTSSATSGGLGALGATGSASGSASGLGIISASVATAGAATSSSSAAAVGMSASAATAFTSGTSLALGMSTALARATGSATVTSSAFGAAASFVSGTGLASGSSTASAQALVAGASVGTASGAATAAAVAAAIARPAGSAAGASDASGFSASPTVRTAAGGATAISTASGTGRSLAATVAAAAGAGDAAGVATALCSAIAVMVGASVAVARGTAGYLAVGVAAGVSQANGAGQSTSLATGTEAGAGFSLGVGRSLSAAAGFVASASTAFAVGQTSYPFPTTVPAGRGIIAETQSRTISAYHQLRVIAATELTRQVIAGMSTRFSPIVGGDTDLFQFDFTPWFPSGIIGGVTLTSRPAGFVFGAQDIVGSKVSVYATAPSKVDFYTLACTASDGSAKSLTMEGMVPVML